MTNKFAASLLLALLAMTPMTGFAASEAVVVVQKKRTFSRSEVTIKRGVAVDFTNEDGFPHQLHVTGPDMDLDSDVQLPGQTIAVPFAAAGTFTVRCDIHPRMHLAIKVE